MIHEAIRRIEEGYIAVTESNAIGNHPELEGHRLITRGDIYRSWGDAGDASEKRRRARGGTSNGAELRTWNREVVITISVVASISRHLLIEFNTHPISPLQIASFHWIKILLIKIKGHLVAAEF